MVPATGALFEARDAQHTRDVYKRQILFSSLYHSTFGNISSNMQTALGVDSVNYILWHVRYSKRLAGVYSTEQVESKSNLDFTFNVNNIHNLIAIDHIKLTLKYYSLYIYEYTFLHMYIDIPTHREIDATTSLKSKPHITGSDGTIQNNIPHACCILFLYSLKVGQQKYLSILLFVFNK